MYRILVVEDDLYVRSNICEILGNEGFLYDSAENGLKGLELAKKNLPDLIISDIMMPVMNGYELLENLLASPQTASIPLIFLTARAGQSEVRRGMTLGADDYLVKPFKIEELLEAIQVRLKKKQMHDRRIDDIKENISSKIPHELRTPLVPIIGYSELIEEEDSLEQIREMAKTIKKSGKILHNKIEKFLSYKDLIVDSDEIRRRLQEKHVTYFTDDMVSLWVSGLDDNLRAVQRTEIHIEASELSILNRYLELIVKELLENGLKYSPHEKKVRISGEKKEAGYRLRVADEGRGIKPEELKQINAFGKFGDNSFTESGLGLGLTIVKEIISLYGGSFSIESEQNSYTTCEIIFPYQS